MTRPSAFRGLDLESFNRSQHVVEGALAGAQRFFKAIQPDVKRIERHETIGGVASQGVTTVALVCSHLVTVILSLIIIIIIIISQSLAVISSLVIIIMSHSSSWMETGSRPVALVYCHLIVTNDDIHLSLLHQTEEPLL